MKVFVIVMILAVLGAVLLIVKLEQRDAACERAGGVQMRGYCIDKDVVIEP